MFDDFCVDLGRDPNKIRHSLVCYPPLKPWASAESFADMIGRFREMGIDEFVLYWPGSWRDDPQEHATFEQIAVDVIPRLRQA
jgi:hypothetical protein